VILAAEEGEFPPISHLVNWMEMALKGSPFAINKVVLINIVAALLTILVFVIANSKKSIVPKGIQHVTEGAVDLVGGIINDVMPHDDEHHKYGAKKFLPLLVAMFFFIFFNNIAGIIPFVQMPATARMALPLFLTILIFLVSNFFGIKQNGIGTHFKSALFPPGVPKALYLLVTPIEFLSQFLVRPFSLAVRLFANIFAGHLLLVIFGFLSHQLATSDSIGLKPVAILPFLMLVFLTLFEVMVAFLQAYIFVLLSAVYIGGYLHPEH
jgi:F-type H+-transporting ATPase subunit a